MADADNPGTASEPPERTDGPSWTQCRPDCIAPRGRQAHCPVDHLTFTTVANFDRHRRHGRCLDPATIGMTTNERGLWLTPATDEDRERMGRAR